MSEVTMSIYVIIETWHHGESWRVVGYAKKKVDAQTFCKNEMPDFDSDNAPCKLVPIQGLRSITTAHYFKYFRTEKCKDPS